MTHGFGVPPQPTRWLWHLKHNLRYWLSERMTICVQPVYTMPHDMRVVVRPLPEYDVHLHGDSFLPDKLHADDFSRDITTLKHLLDKHHDAANTYPQHKYARRFISRLEEVCEDIISIQSGRQLHVKLKSGVTFAQFCSTIREAYSAFLRANGRDNRVRLDAIE